MPDSEAIYKSANVTGGFRVGAKTYALGQALIFTVPLIITVLQATNKWKMDPHWMIGTASFLFAEFATQASQQWERSAQKWVSFFSKAHNGAIRDKCLKKPLRIEYQRSHLIELNQKFKDHLPYLSPELLQMLKGNMNLNNKLTEEDN